MEPYPHLISAQRLANKINSLPRLLVVVTLIYLPFLFLMPPHIDDPIFLKIADNISQHPLLPMGQPFQFEGQLAPDLLTYSHPPLLAYYLYIFQWLGGILGLASLKIQILHLAMYAFAVLALCSFFKLCRELNFPAFSGGILFAFSPLVMICGHTLMMDVPAMALGLGTVAWSFEATFCERSRGPIWAGLMLAAGCLTSYSAAFYAIPALVPTLCHPQRWRRAIWLLLPSLVALLFWFGLVWGITGQLVPEEMLRFSRHVQQRDNQQIVSLLLYLFATMGSCMLVPLGLAFAPRRSLQRILITGLLFAFFIMMGYCLFPTRPIYSGLVGITATAGLVFLGCAIKDVLRQKRSSGFRTRLGTWMCAIWLLTFFPLTAIAYPNASARYAIWMLPPVLLVFLKRWRLSDTEKTDINHRTPGDFLRHRWLVSIVGIQMIWGLVAATGDLDLARAYACIPSQLRSPVAPCSRWWFAGEWGIRYAMERAGGKMILCYDTRPRPGDYLLKPKLNASTWDTGYESLPFGRPLSEIRLPARLPWRILDHPSRAGFWSDYWGMLPITCSSSPYLDVCVVYRIERTLPSNPTREAESNYPAHIRRVSPLSTIH